MVFLIKYVYELMYFVTIQIEQPFKDKSIFLREGITLTWQKCTTFLMQTLEPKQLYILMHWIYLNGNISL